MNAPPGIDEGSGAMPPRRRIPDETSQMKEVLWLGPFLAETLQVRTAKIFGGHRNSELDFGVEVEEPWLGQPRDIGWAIDIHDQDSTAFAVTLREPDVFGLDGVENLFHLHPDGSVLDESVEGFNGTLNEHDHAHV
jgi:hypothetical protein